jgi:hypothetical protein
MNDLALKAGWGLDMNRNGIRSFALAVTVAILTPGALTAEATVIDTNWGTNATSIVNVVDASTDGVAPTDRLRLQGGFLTGSLQGTVTLPFVANWTIEADINTDGQNNLPTEFVNIFIDDFTAGNEVATFFNTPVATTYPFSYSFTGDSFDFRFEFDSPSIDFGSHLIVEAGTVTAAMPESGSLALLGLGLTGLVFARRRRSA